MKKVLLICLILISPSIFANSGEWVDAVKVTIETNQTELFKVYADDELVGIVMANYQTSKQDPSGQNVFCMNIRANVESFSIIPENDTDSAKTSYELVDSCD